MTGRTESKIRLTPDEREQITKAESKLAETVDAHEKMRMFYFPAGWSGPFRDQRDWIIEVRKLDPDLITFVLTLLQILAVACWRLGSAELFRDEFERIAPSILERAIAKVPEQDRPLLDRVSLMTVYGDRVKYWVERATENLLPTWMVHDQEEPAESPGKQKIVLPTSLFETQQPSAKSTKPALVDSETRSRRRDFLKRYRVGKAIRTMPDFARHLGMSQSAIEGIVRGDTTRYGQRALVDFLEKIGVKPEEW